MQVFTNLQFKFFWLLGVFCYVIFVGEASWGQLEDVNNNLHYGQDTTGTLGRGAPTKTLKELGYGQQPTTWAEGAGIDSFGDTGGGKKAVKPKPKPRAQKPAPAKPKVEAVVDNRRCENGIQPHHDGKNNFFCDCGDGESVPYGKNCSDLNPKEADADKGSGPVAESTVCNGRGGDWESMNTYCRCFADGSGGRTMNLADSNDFCVASGTNFAGICESKGGRYGASGASHRGEVHFCQCKSDNQALASDWATNDATTCIQQAVAPTVNDTEAILQACGYSDAANKVAKCMDKSVSALKTCDKKALESDENNETAKGILGILAQVHTQKGVQSGNADVCGDVAKKTTAASWLLDGLKETCSKEITDCKASCANLGDNYNWAELDKKCTTEFRKKFPELAALDAAPVQVRGASRAAAIAANDKAVREKRAPTYAEKELSDGVTQSSIRQLVAELKTESEANAKKCEYDAPKNERDLLGYAEDVVKAAIGAAACKNAVGVNANRCAQLAATLSPQWCQGNRSEPCCEPYLYGSLDCAQRDYNAVACICQRNQSDPVCRTTTVVGTGNSQLAAPGSTANLAAPGGIKAGAASKPTNFNGDGFNVNEDPNAGGKPPAAATGPSMNPFAGTSGGGGGGGVSAPGAAGGGGGPGEKGAAEPESQGLVGGAFSALKTVADRVFGGGGSGGKGGFGPGRAADLKKKNGRIDPEKWRPTGLRGVAGVSGEVGPKSRDIWKQMNAQYATQYHTFLDGMPSK